MNRCKRGPLGVGERVGDEELVRRVLEMRVAGSSLRAIAGELNGLGWTTPQGKAWHQQQVSNVLRRTTRATSLTLNGTEYYSPTEVIEAARTVLGHIDLDPCSCEAANEVVRADAYYTRNQDGFRQTWWGRVWVNPPGRRGGQKNSQAQWWDRLVRQYQTGAVEAGIFLSFNLSLLSNGQSCALAVQAFPFMVFRQRVRYGRPDGRRMAVPYCHSMAIFVGRNPAMIRRFVGEFAKFGAVAVPGNGEPRNPHSCTA